MGEIEIKFFDNKIKMIAGLSLIAVSILNLTVSIYGMYVVTF